MQKMGKYGIILLEHSYPTKGKIKDVGGGRGD